MPLESMTGFGRGEAGAPPHRWQVEIRSVNHRYLDVRVALPKGLLAVEEAVRARIGQRLGRGRIEAHVSPVDGFKGRVTYHFDLDQVRRYGQWLEEAAPLLPFQVKVEPGFVFSWPGVVREEESGYELDTVTPLVLEAADQALAALLEMQIKEGERLGRELAGRLAHFASLVEEVEAMAPGINERRRQELVRRLEGMAGEVPLDPARLAQEAAILCDRGDVTEELVRLRSHVAQFRRFLGLDEPVGRRLDFLLQEFLRETNTLVSKIADSEVAHLCVEMKNEIEKLREQVQNLK